MAVADIEEASGKMCSIEAGKLQKLASLCDVMLIEADGAKHKPLKVPADWEPVIPEFADIVVSVIGLDCLASLSVRPPTVQNTPVLSSKKIWMHR